MVRDKFLGTHYGHMHKRLIRSIMNMQSNYPTTRILIRKDDFKRAYQQQHLSAKATIQSSTQINRKETLHILISLRITFGWYNGPSKWITIAKPIADLRNALLLDNIWEPQEIQATNQDLIPPSSTQDASNPFAQSKPLSVDTPVDPRVKIDIYLDDCITVIPDIGNNGARGNAAIPIAIHAVSQPLYQKETVPRNEMIEPSKAKA